MSRTINERNQRAQCMRMQAVLARKLVVPEVYDLMIQVQALMIRSQAAPVRQACSTVRLKP